VEIFVHLDRATLTFTYSLWHKGAIVETQGGFYKHSCADDAAVARVAVLELDTLIEQAAMRHCNQLQNTVSAS